MLRILWASPLPPIRSGVSDYAVELLPALAERAKVRVVTPPGWRQPDDRPLADTLALVPPSTQPQPGELSLVHLGNNPYHEWLIDLLQRPRCVAVLHDLVLHHLLVESTLAHGDHRAYEEALSAAYGEPGRVLAEARRHAAGGRRDPFLFPAFQVLLRHTRAAVVHSEWARRQVISSCQPDLPVLRMPLAMQDPGPQDRQALRRRLGIDEQTVLLMHLGFLTPEKGVREILTAVSAARHTGLPVHLVLVGEGSLLDTIGEAAAALDLGSCVTATGWVPSHDMQGLPAAADLGVVLRRPSAGETSAAALRFLACGTPVAVSGLRQFLEWPEAAAPRLTPGPSTAAELVRLLAEVATARADGRWQQRRLAARSAYEDGHPPDQAAARLVSFLEGL